jgi:glycine cleavage system H protein
MGSSPKLAGLRVLPEGAQPCVWMTAGLLTYKLCDRDLDCEHCALDAALRGERLPVSPGRASRPPAAWAFPDDRRYGRTHLWAQAIPQGGVRLGVDALAAGLLGDVRAVVLPDVGTALRSGKSAVRFEVLGGSVILGIPTTGVVTATNSTLASHPDLVVAEPYTAGWLLEHSAPTFPVGDRVDGLLSARDTAQEAALALRRLWRRIAMELLAGTAQAEAALADWGGRLAGLRQILDGPRYLELVTEALC